MSVFEKLEAATDSRDVNEYLDLMADDAVFVRHQTGQTLNKAQVGEMLTQILSGASIEKRRCIYENDDILVVHSVNDYADGTREAVLLAYTLRDGKIVRLETGATPLSK